MKTVLNTAIATALAAAALSASPAAQAVITLDSFSQPGGHCQPARQYPDARIREAEIDNIGTTNVYVVCSPPAHYQSGQTLNIQMVFLNSDSSERTVKCTLRNTVLGEGNFGVTVREVVLPAGSASTMQFTPDDTELYGLAFAGIQCILPTKVSMGYTYIVYEENDDVAP